MANKKKTRDKAAASASRLLRTSSDPDVLRVAGSALSQSDPRKDHKHRPRRPRPSFKAGKDLGTADPAAEGGGTE
jgi:hypothetical protein